MAIELTLCGSKPKGKHANEEEVDLIKLVNYFLKAVPDH